MLENTEGQSRETDKIEDTVKHNKNTAQYVVDTTTVLYVQANTNDIKT